jgi:hypothetical protein
MGASTPVEGRTASSPITHAARPGRRSLLGLNLMGGSAVLGSYAHGLATNPLTRGQLWGGVPEWLQPLYTASMLLAAAGYFAFGFFVFFRLDPRRTRVLGRFGYGAFHLLYGLILLPSALWLPLTFAMLEAPDDGLWRLIRVVLALVAAGSLGLVAAIASARPREARLARRVALAGALLFAFQTAVLDALVWPAFFPR